MRMKTNWHLPSGLCCTIRCLVSQSDRRFFSPLKVALLLLCCYWVTACDGELGNSQQIAQPPKFSQAPQLTQSNTVVSLAAIVSFEADQPVTASYRISDGPTSWQAHSRGVAFASQNKLQTAHSDVLLKFKPNTSHRIYVRITNARGQSTEFSKPLRFQTPALPADFPKITVDLAADPDLHTEIALISHIHTQTEPWATEGKIIGWLIALDSAGTVVWYMPTDTHWHTIQQLQSGNLHLYSHTGNALEVDMLGNKQSAWLSPAESNPEYHAAKAYFTYHRLVPEVRPVAIVDRLVTGPNQHRLATTGSTTSTHSIAEFDSQGAVLQRWNQIGRAHV